MQNPSFPFSELDPTGLVPVQCGHGIRLHPFPHIQHSSLGRLAATWVRSRYATIRGRCVVDDGAPAPVDLVPGWDDQLPIWCYVELANVMPERHRTMPCCIPHWPPYCIGSVGELQPTMDMQPMEPKDSAKRTVPHDGVVE